MRDSMLVSPAWLARHLHDPGIVVLHVEMRMGAHPGPRAYDSAHIPGARFASAHELTIEPGTDLPSPDSVAAVLSALGIAPRDRVILYGDPWMNGRAWVALESVGHARVAMLDGGVANWQAAGLPVETAEPRFARTSYRPRPRTDLIVDRAWVEAHLRDPTVTLLDGRSPSEYAGTNAMEGLKRPGHIPGAYNLDFAQTFADTGRGAMPMPGGPLKSVRDLRAMLHAAGVHPGQTVITYCTVGMRASHLQWLLRYLGYDARMYDGSMSDWSDHSTLPVVTGTARGTP